VAVAVVDVQVKSANAVSQLRQINTASSQAQGAIQGLAKAAAGLALVEFGRRSVQAAASINDLNTRLKLLTTEYGEFEQAQRLAGQAAKTFGLSTREATAGVADIYARLRPLGISLEEISSTYKGFNVIARLSGVSAEGASAAFTQLAQALGSGRLQGDEFRSIAEQVPGLLQAVAEETGKSVGQLKEFASEGKLTSDILISALQKVEKEGAGKIAKLVQESDVQKFKDLQNAVDELSTAFGQTLLPAVTPIVKLLTDLVKTIGQLPSPVRTAAVAIGALALAVKTLNGSVSVALIQRLGVALGTLAGVTKSVTVGYTVAGAAITQTNLVINASTIALGALKAAMIALPFAIISSAIAIYINDVRKAEEHTRRYEDALKSESTAQLDAALKAEIHTQALIRQRVASQQLSASGKRGGGFGLISAQKDLETSNARILKLRDALNIAAEKEESTYQSATKTQSTLESKAKGRADISARQLELEAQLLEAQKRKDIQEQAYLEKLIRREQIANQEMKPRERMLALLQSEFQYSDRIKQIRQEIADIMAGAAIKPSDAFAEGTDGSIFTKGFDESKQHADELKKKLENLLKPLEQVKLASAAISDAFSQGISGMVQGTVTAQQALAGFFRSVSQSFLNMATDIIRAAIRMMAFNVIASLFPGAPSFSASTMTAPGLAGKLNVPGILPGISPAGALASGGTAMGGKTYLVGERGPELFTPGRTGSVAPNGSFGSNNIVVNVDATGSNVQGNGNQAKALGSAIGAAVRAELINQQRPGGLLA
jgi:tape measure domain-containing protein